MADLHDIYNSEPEFLKGAMIADKVVGKGAAVFMVAGGIKELQTRVISNPALHLLESNGIIVQYGTLVENISNRDNTDICPVEKLCAISNNIPDLISIIDNFISTMRNKNLKHQQICKPTL